MIKLAPVILDDKNLLENWFDSDSIGKKELISYENFSDWFKLLTPSNRWGWIVIEDENKIGFIDLEKDLNNVGYFSFYLKQTERNKGKSKSVLLSLIKKSEELGISILEARINENNVPSKKSVELVGFALKDSGKDEYLIYTLPIKGSKHI